MTQILPWDFVAAARLEQNINLSRTTNRSISTHSVGRCVNAGDNFTSRFHGYGTFRAEVTCVSWGAKISGQKMYGQTFFDASILSLELLL